jgi:hypothetical protein
MKDSSSPEDKLLRLIRNPKKTPDSSSAKINTQKEKVAPIGNKKGSFDPKTRIKKLKASLTIRKTCFWLFICSCVYLISALIYPWLGLKNIRLPKSRKRTAIERRISKDSIKQIDQYLENMGGRSIFSKSPFSATSSTVSAANIDIMKDITLVGIISGDNPQAIIEDKKVKKTYYLGKGQFIGEMQIEDIQEGKVIINYAGQKYELYM